MKFISEMNADEKAQHVFGANHRRDSKGNPIEDGRGSDAHFASGQYHDSNRAHLDGVYFDEGQEAADKEYGRIRKLQIDAGSPVVEWKAPRGDRRPI